MKTVRFKSIGQIERNKTYLFTKANAYGDKSWEVGKVIGISNDFVTTAEGAVKVSVIKYITELT